MNVVDRLAICRRWVVKLFINFKVKDGLRWDGIWEPEEGLKGKVKVEKDKLTVGSGLKNRETLTFPDLTPKKPTHRDLKSQLSLKVKETGILRGLTPRVNSHP